MASPFVELEVGGRTVKVTNPDKVFFRTRGETKLDLVRHYLTVGEGIVRALTEAYNSHTFPYAGSRGLLILAEMTTKGSLAIGDYTKLSVEIARKYPTFVVGFVATRALSSISPNGEAADAEDFVVFTTGVNRKSVWERRQDS